MNAIELHHKDGRSAGVFYCEKCRNVASTLDQAEQCCKPRLCLCGAELKRYWTACDQCRNAAFEIQEHEKELERFAKAKKITEWAGWVYDGSNYFESVDLALEDYEDEGNKPPEYLWACTPNQTVHADVDDVISDIGSELEDFDADDLNGLPELKLALEAFNESNRDNVYYLPDYSKAVLLAEYIKDPIL